MSCNDLYSTEGEDDLDWRIPQLEAWGFKGETGTYMQPKANFLSMSLCFCSAGSSFNARFPAQAWCDEKAVELSIIDIIPEADIRNAKTLLIRAWRSRPFDEGSKNCKRDAQSSTIILLYLYVALRLCVISPCFSMTAFSWL